MLLVHTVANGGEATHIGIYNIQKWLKEELNFQGMMVAFNSCKVWHDQISEVHKYN